MTLTDNDVLIDIILEVKVHISPNLIGHHENDRDQFMTKQKLNLRR